MQRYVIDRFEEQFAICEVWEVSDVYENTDACEDSKVCRNNEVCENGIYIKMIKIKKDYLPIDVKEGDIIKFENNKYIIDKKEMEQVEKRIKDKMDRLFKD